MLSKRVSAKMLKTSLRVTKLLLLS